MNIIESVINKFEKCWLLFWKLEWCSGCTAYIKYTVWLYCMFLINPIEFCVAQKKIQNSKYVITFFSIREKYCPEYCFDWTNWK